MEAFQCGKNIQYPSAEDAKSEKIKTETVQYGEKEYRFMFEAGEQPLEEFIKDLSDNITDSI